MTPELYKEITEYLRSLILSTEWEGHVYAVGGCCRDLLLGLPIKDIDLAVDLPDGGIRFANTLHARGLTVGAPTVFPAFGTARIRLKAYPEDEIELVQTRREKYTDRNSRNPETVFGTLQEDCFRRDLTVNSLYYDITRGKTLDLTGHGISDIRYGVIRTPLDPDTTFDDDPIRILRCIRFATRYGWEISDDIMESMRKNVGRLRIIKIERLSNELISILTGNHADKALMLLRSIGALRYLIPELHSEYDEHKNSGLGELWDNTMSVVAVMPPDLYARLGALLHNARAMSEAREIEKSKSGKYWHQVAEDEKFVASIVRHLRFFSPIARRIQGFMKAYFQLKRICGAKEMVKDSHIRRLQYLCREEGVLANLLLLATEVAIRKDADYCARDRLKYVAKRSQELSAAGTSCYDYRLPLKDEDIRKIRMNYSKKRADKIMDRLLGMAFSNPGITREALLRR